MTSKLFSISDKVMDKDLNKGCQQVGKVTAIDPIIVNFGGLHVRYKPNEIKYLTEAKKTN